MNLPANKNIFITTLLLVIFNSLFAQSYYFRKYQVENGLSNNATICSLQDRKGFLWFGTKDGLNRFDGYTFKIFRSDPDDSTSIGNNFIHSLFEDNKGILWVGTENGLYKYDAPKECFNLIKSTDVGRIRDIKMDGEGNLWFILGFTLFKYKEQSNNLTLFATDLYFETTSICTSADGKLWASNSAGEICKYNASNNTFSRYTMFQHSKKPVSKWIEKIYCTSNNSILVGTSNQGAKLFDINTLTYDDILTYNKDRTEIFARNFAEISKSEYWIATETGIFIYNTNTRSEINLQKKTQDPYSISDNAVYSISKDKEGGIWVSTYFGGINYYPKQHTPFKKYFPRTEENSISGNVVREIHQDNDGNLWIGTEDAGLNKLNTSTGIFTHYLPGNKNGISYTNIHGLLVDGNQLWIGTFEHGLDVMNIKTGRVIKHFGLDPGENALKSNFIYCISKLPAGDIILGTTRGAYSFNKKNSNFSLLPGMPLNIWYTCLKMDSDSILWAGSYGTGITFFNTKTRKGGNFRYEANNKNSVSSDRVNAIFEDSDKNLWFATEGGLCRFNRTSNDFKRYTTKNGFSNNFILSMLEDDNKNLWLSTSKGLICFNIKTEKTTVYTARNGILNDQFNFNSAYKDKNGIMYFGSVKGMISFNPREFIKNTFIPPVYITSFQLFNKDLAIAQNGSPLQKSISYTNKITLQHDQSTINIGFAALGYTAPEMSEYAYKMEGLDKGWTYLKRNRNAYFTNLAPGTYTFKVKASNSSGVWNDNATKLTVEILPPWWQSNWAYFIYILLAGFILYSGFRYYHNRIEEKNRRKFEFIERAKEKEIFKAKLDFFTNVAHEIRTPLTLIKGPLEKVIKKADGLPEIKNHLAIMERNTNRLVDLTNQLLDFRQTEIEEFRLSFVKANISELLEETFESFKVLADQKNLFFTLTLPLHKVLAAVDLDAFNKILSNLLSNAIKYANSKVGVSLLAADDEDIFFTIEIENDGFLIPYEMKAKIFEPFFRLKETEKQKGTGIGLSLSRSLVQLHKGSLYLKETDKSLNIFCLQLPVHQENEFDLRKILITGQNND